MSIRSISVSAAISYLSEKWREKTMPKTTGQFETQHREFKIRQDRFFDWVDKNPGKSGREWRNDLF